MLGQIARHDPFRSVRGIEPVERRLTGLEEVQIDPSAQFAVGPLDLTRGVPAA